MSAFDDNFAYAVVSSSNRTLKITGVNPTKYNAQNLSWGSFPVIPILYAGPSTAYNGYEFPENAFSVVEIVNGAFNGRTEFAEGPLVLSSTIQRIGDNAFNGVKISGRLMIPASVTYIGTQAFANTLIDELVVENETTSDVLSGVVDLTRVASKETVARAAQDTSLNTLKVPKADPTFTGVTTIPNAVISVATITNATITTANVTNQTAAAATIDYYESNVSDDMKNSRFQILTTTGNLLSFNGTNENVAPIEIVLSSGVYRDGAALVSELYSKLNSKNITWVGGSVITWAGTSFDPIANVVKLGYSTDAPTAVISVTPNPTMIIRTKFVKNGVAYDSSKILGAVGATVGSNYEDGAFLLTYGNRNGLSFPQAINLNAPTLMVNGTANLDGTVGVSGQWNFLANKPKYNAQVLATESYTQSKIKMINGNAILSTVKTLADIANAINVDANFAVNAQSSQTSIASTIKSIARVRSTAVSSISSALSSQVSALQSTDSSLSVGISNAIPVRVSQVESVSASLQTTVSGLQSTDLSISSALTAGTSNRSSQTRSLNSEISTAASLLRNTDIVISTGISNATLVRSLNISTNSSALSTQVAALQSVDVVLSTAITDGTTARSNALASLSSLVSTTVPALVSADTAFNTALVQGTTDRIASVAALSGAVSAQVSATQSMNAVILPKISGSASLVPSAATSTVFNLLGVKNNDSLTFVKMGGSGTFAVGDKITITYSATDYLKGTVTSFTGSDVTFTVTSKATSAAETQIYTTTGSFGASTASTSGSHVVELTQPAFVPANNCVITSMTGAMFSSSNTGTYRVSLLNASNAVIATSLMDELYNQSQTPVLHTFNTAFVAKGGANFKQKFTFNSGNSTQIIVNFSDYKAYTTMMGYMVPYNSGSVQIDSNGALQSTRILAIGSLSANISNAMGSLQGALATNQTDFASNATARNASIGAIISATTQSMGSVQNVVSTLGSTLTVATAERSANTASLSSLISTNMTALSSTAASMSSALSTQILNRSTQVLNGMTALVGAAPSSLDTLFEIATALDGGPQLYSVITATEQSLTSNISARNSGVTSVSTSLSVAASTLQAADIMTSSGISTATLTRTNSVTSLSTALSNLFSVTRSRDASLSSEMSSNVSARIMRVTSVSSLFSNIATTLGLTDSNVISSGISTAVSARQSGVASASTSLSNTIVGLQTVNSTLSSGISTAVLARQSGVASLSGSLSGVVSAQKSSMELLSTAFSTLNGGINLNALANITAVDSAITQVVGVGAISELDTLSEIAAAINNNATIGATFDNLLNNKAATSVVLSLSNATLLKVNQTDLTQLSTTIGTKANGTLANQLQSVVSSLSSGVDGISSELQSLQSSMSINGQVVGQLSDAIRQVDTMYVYYGLVNADGSIKYKVNSLVNMVLQASSLAFAIDANYAITKVTQVATMKFDPTQSTVKYTSRGVEFTLNPISLTNGLHTFNVDSSGTTDYTNNATEIVVTGVETDLRYAPDNSPLTIPKLTLSSYIYATPTVTTPYDATTWNDSTGKISQVVRINYESGVQKLQIDGTVYTVSGTTQKLHTLEYFPGASGTLNVKVLNSEIKMESATLSLSNVYNDYAQHAAPVEVGGSKSVTVSGTTYTYAATYTTTASTVELQVYDIGTSTYGSSDLTASGGVVSVSVNYAFGQIGQPLFRLRAKTSNGKRISAFTNVANGEAITFYQPVQSNVSYTTLSAGSYRVTATYAVHPLASAVKVIDPSTAATHVSSQAASGGSVTFSVDYTETQVTNGISFAVITLANSYGLQSIVSAAFVPLGQHDAPAYVNDGSKLVTLSGSTYTYSATYTSTSSTGINVYDHTGAFIKTVTGTSPFTVVQTYNSSRLGLVAFKLSSKNTATKRESALIDIIGDDIPTHDAPTTSSGASSGITYGTSGANHTAQMNYTVNYRVDAVNVLNPDGSALPNGASFTQSIVSTTGPSRVISVTVTFSNLVSPLSVAVFAANNAYGKQSTLYVSKTLLGLHDKPTISSSISYTTVSAGSYRADMNYAVSSNVTSVQVRKASGDKSVVPNVTHNFINGTTVAVSVPFTEPLEIEVFALENSVGRESAASVSQPLAGAYAAPIFNSVTYSGTGPYTATLSYTVASGVTAVQVLKASDKSVISGTSTSFNGTGTIATITVPFTETIGIVVVALGNASGQQSAESFPAQPLLIRYNKPMLNSVTYSGTTATLTYNVSSGVTAVQVRKASDNGVISVLSAPVNGTIATITMSLTETIEIVVVALGNASGRESAASDSTPLLIMHDKPMLNSVTYSGNTATLTYNVSSGVTAVQVRKASDNGVISVLSAPVNGTIATITMSLTETIEIVVVALGNASGRESAASDSTPLLIMHDKPMLNSVTYSGTGPYTATLTHNVSSGVNAVQVRKASDNSVISGASASVSGTIATITVPFTETIGIVVVALGNASGRESAASDSTPLLIMHDKPMLNSLTYSGTGPYTATLTHNVSSGVNAVQVRKASDNSVISGASASVSGTIATITVPFTETIGIVVVALGNASGRESAASDSTPLLIMHAKPMLNSVTYSGTGPYTATLSYTVASGVTAVEVRKASDNSVISGASALVNQTTAIATITVPFTETIGIVVVALGNSGGQESAASASQKLLGMRVTPTISGNVSYTYTGNVTNATISYNYNATDISTLTVLNSDMSPLASDITVSTNGVTSVSDAFTTMYPYDLNFNKIYKKTITGTNDANIYIYGGPQYYTTNSDISKTAVHSGVLAVGETKTVYIKIVDRVALGLGFNGSIINGVRSYDNYNYNDNGYTFVSAPADQFKLYLSYTNSNLPLSIVTIAPGDENIRQSAASAPQSLQGIIVYAAPTFNSVTSYSGTGPYTATMTYNVASGVTALQVLKASDKSVISGVSALVSGTTATITVPFTETIGIVVVALGNSSGQQSAESFPAQTLLSVHAKPTLISNSVAYSGTGPYTATLSYTVVSGVTAVSVLNSDLTALTGASVTTNYITENTAYLGIYFTDAVAPLGIVVVAQGNNIGRESAASASQTLMAMHSAPTSGNITYGSSSGSSINATMNYTVNSNPDAVILFKSDNSEITNVDNAIFIIDALNDMNSYNSSSNINNIYRIFVTGSSSAGNIYGTGTYTTNSTLSKAAVHAGILASGETQMVYVKIVSALSSYTGSTQNGITSTGYTNSGTYLGYQFISLCFTQSIVSTGVISATVSFMNAIAPISIVAVAKANSNRRQSVVSQSQNLLGAFAAPVKLTQSTTASSTDLATYSIANNTFSSTTPGITLNGFPNLGAFDKSWDLHIYFNCTSGAGTNRLLVGQQYTWTSIAWAIHISTTNTIVHNKDFNMGLGFGSNNLDTYLSVALNTNYYLKVVRKWSTPRSFIWTLKNLDANTETVFNTTMYGGSGESDTNRLSRIGEWTFTPNYKFIGTIKKVAVGLLTSTGTYSTTAESVGLYDDYNTQIQTFTPSNGIATVIYDYFMNDQYKLVSIGNSTKRNSEYLYLGGSVPPSINVSALNILTKYRTSTPFDLTPYIVSNSSGALSFDCPSNNGIITLSGSTATIIGLGSVVITVNQAAGGSYSSGSNTATLNVTMQFSAGTTSYLYQKGSYILPYPTETEPIAYGNASLYQTVNNNLDSNKFGTSMDISTDGKFIVVGDPYFNANSGAGSNFGKSSVYYLNSSNNWVNVYEFTPSSYGYTNILHGAAVAISGNGVCYVAVEGTNSLIRIFKSGGVGQTNFTNQLNLNFYSNTNSFFATWGTNSCISLSGSGYHLAIGTKGEGTNGSVRTFRTSERTYTIRTIPDQTPNTNYYSFAGYLNSYIGSKPGTILDTYVRNAIWTSLISLDNTGLSYDQFYNSSDLWIGSIYNLYDETYPLLGNSSEQFGLNVKMSVDACKLMVASTTRIVLYSRTLRELAYTDIPIENRDHWSSLRSFTYNFAQPAHSMHLSQNGTRIVVTNTNSNTNSVVVYDVSSGNQVFQTSSTSTNNFGYLVALSGDGSVLSITQQNNIYIWSVNNNTQIGSFANSNITTTTNQSLRLSVDGSSVVYSNGNANVFQIYKVPLTSYVTYSSNDQAIVLPNSNVYSNSFMYFVSLPPYNVVDVYATQRVNGTALVTTVKSTLAITK